MQESMPALTQKQIEQIFDLVEQTPVIETFDETFTLSPYTYAQMRRAIYQQATELTFVVPHSDGVRGIKKPLGSPLNGFALLTLSDPSLWAIQNTASAEVTLGFYQTSGRLNTISWEAKILVEMKVPGTEPAYAHRYRFWDLRATSHREIETDISSPKTPEEVKFTWLAIRCVCQNMRTWAEPGIVWPEALEE